MPAAVDGELAIPEALDIEQHLETCAACSRTHAAQRLLRERLQAHATRHRAPAALVESVERLLDPRRRFRWPSWQPQALRRHIPSFAAAVALGFAIGLVLLRQPMVERVQDAVVASHVRALMASRAVDVDSDDRHVVKPWFGGRLDYSPQVIDLRASGFPLAGARLDYIDGRPVAALVYHRRQHIIDVYEWPAQRTSNEFQGTRQGYHLIHWADAGLAYWVVSDLEPGELNDFARMLRTRDAR